MFQISAFRPKSKAQGSNSSSKAYVPASKPKNLPWSFSRSLITSKLNAQFTASGQKYQACGPNNPIDCKMLLASMIPHVPNWFLWGSCPSHFHKHLHRGIRWSPNAFATILEWNNLFFQVHGWFLTSIYFFLCLSLLLRWSYSASGLVMS